MKETLQLGVETLAAMQDILYAQDKWSLLLIFQAMDAAGKDGAIKHVMSGVNPQGCQVTSFKAPSPEELDHDFLWRCQKQLPERGRIGIFNRSYYEEVLVVRVHEAILKAEKLPEKTGDGRYLEATLQRHTQFREIPVPERDQGGQVLSQRFQRRAEKRFIERIDNPEKNWKFSAADAKERNFWKNYMKAYEEMIRETSTKKSPWYVVPADNKSFARVVIVSAVIDALDGLGLKYPRVSQEKIAELQAIKKILLEEK